MTPPAPRTVSAMLTTSEVVTLRAMQAKFGETPSEVVRIALAYLAADVLDGPQERT